MESCIIIITQTVRRVRAIFFGCYVCDDYSKGYKTF